MKRVFLMVAALALGAPTAMAEERGVSPAPDDQPSVQSEFNKDEDFTRPVRLLQLRERYEDLPNTKGLNPEKWQTTLRTDVWNGLGEGWKLYGRADAPLVYSNDVTSRFNPEGKAKFGQGDLLTEVVLIPPPPSNPINGSLKRGWGSIINLSRVPASLVQGGKR